MKHTWVCVAVLIVTACDTSPSVPAAPTPTAPTPMAPTPAPQYSLSGVVRVAGAPVAGSKVALLKLQELTASVVTDGSGSYRFPAVENVSFSGALVSVSKPEYFTETKYILMSQDQKADFDLERAVNISEGQVVQSPIGGGARCASLGYGGMGGAACQRFALTVPVSGTLEVTVSSTPPLPFDVTVLRPDGTIGVYGSSSFSPLKVAIPVAAGLMYQIDVIHASPAARDFELTTTLR